MEQGKTHTNGALPRVGEVLSLGDGLHRHLDRQKVKNVIVPGDDVARYLWVKVI